MTEDERAAVLKAHQWNPRTGTCSCRWEPASDRGAEQQHERHVARVLEGTEPPAGSRGPR